MEKNKHRSFKILSVLLAMIIIIPFAVTLAWFTSTDSATGEIGFGEGINVKIDGNETQTFKLFESAGKLVPGSKITPNPVKLNVAASSTPFVLRARVKIDSSGGTLPQELLSSFINGIGIVENSWLEHDGWFYYIGYGATGNFVMNTVSENATKGSGTTINGAVYTPQTTERTKPTTNEEDFVLTSIYAQNAMAVNFTNPTVPFFRIDTSINADDIAGKEISVNLEVQAVQDFIVLDDENVFPTIANAKQVFSTDEVEFWHNYFDFDFSVLPTEYFDAAGTDADPFQIKSAQDLAYMSHMHGAFMYPQVALNLEEFKDAEAQLDLMGQYWIGGWIKEEKSIYTYELMNDIDLGGKYWVPIKLGTMIDIMLPDIKFNGNNHTISNVTIKEDRITYTETDNYIGLFGRMSNGEINNLNVVNINYDINDTSVPFYEDNYTGIISRINIGGLIGSADSDVIIKNVNVTGKITTNSGYAFVGGVVGDGSLINSNENLTSNVQINVGSGSESGPVYGQLD